MKCKICDLPFLDDYETITDELCTNCWEVTTRLEEFIKSWGGRMLVIELMNKPYKEKQDG